MRNTPIQSIVSENPELHLIIKHSLILLLMRCCWDFPGLLLNALLPAASDLQRHGENFQKYPFSHDSLGRLLSSAIKDKEVESSLATTPCLSGLFSFRVASCLPTKACSLWMTRLGRDSSSWHHMWGVNGGLRLRAWLLLAPPVPALIGTRDMF